jgi:hypothetical protein
LKGKIVCCEKYGVTDGRAMDGESLNSAGKSIKNTTITHFKMSVKILEKTQFVFCTRFDKVLLNIRIILIC